MNKNKMFFVFCFSFFFWGGQAQSSSGEKRPQKTKKFQSSSSKESSSSKPRKKRFCMGGLGTGDKAANVMLKHRREKEEPENGDRLLLFDTASKEKGSFSTTSTTVGLGEGSLERATRSIRELEDPSYAQYLKHKKPCSPNDFEEADHFSTGSIGFDSHTLEAATVAVAYTIEVTRKVATGESANGVAVVRPPGHHASSKSCGGFCIHNNVALGVREAQKHGKQKIMIIDWDVHFGDGTEAIFRDDPDVLYLSVHRNTRTKREGLFFPGLEKEQGAQYTGGSLEDGKSGTINIAWSRAGKGDRDYIYAFERVVIPILREFGPDMVFISAGFDAAAGDPLGGCSVTPGGYAEMTRKILQVKPEGVVLVLEGGYNPRAIDNCLTACIDVMEGNPKASKTVKSRRGVFAYTQRDIAETIGAHGGLWPCLEESSSSVLTAVAVAVGSAGAKQKTKTGARQAKSKKKSHRKVWTPKFGDCFMVPYNMEDRSLKYFKGRVESSNRKRGEFTLYFDYDGERAKFSRLFLERHCQKIP